MAANKTTQMHAVRPTVLSTKVVWPFFRTFAQASLSTAFMTNKAKRSYAGPMALGKSDGDLPALAAALGDLNFICYADAERGRRTNRAKNK